MKIPTVSGNRIVLVDAASVRYVRAEGHYTWVHTAQGSSFCNLTISDLESRLDTGSFLRIHRSYLANLDFAEQIVRDDGKVMLKLSGGDERPAGRARQRAAPARAPGHHRARRRALTTSSTVAVRAPLRAVHAVRGTPFVHRPHMLRCTVAIVVAEIGPAPGGPSRVHQETVIMIPAGFDYHAPRSVADAIQLLGELGPDAKLLAGGHSLLPMMKLRFAAAEPPDRPGQDRRTCAASRRPATRSTSAR